MKNSNYRNFFLPILIVQLFISCEDFVEVDTPTHKIIGKAVFENEESANSVIQGIYNQLESAAFSGGWQNSVTALAGLSADDLSSIRDANLTYREFDENEITTINNRNLDLWSSSYNIIYMANSLLEGIRAADGLNETSRNSLEGEAKFIRAFTYFYLTNLYGEVPLLLTTSYDVNATASRNSPEEVYFQIIEDLESAVDLLPADYDNEERINVNSFAAMALLARVHLFQKNWTQAESLSSGVIEQTEKYEVLDSLSQVFLANSREAIWQISPLGRGSNSTHTNEGAIFIIHPTSPTFSNIKLDETLITLYDSLDLRKSSWIGFHQELDLHYPFKYKDQNSSNDLTEYSMVLRLAEQYLIRAEARVMLNDFDGAISDLDVIRARAGIELLSNSASEFNKEELLEIIMEERWKELFSEWGHRWLDLKRTGMVSDVLGETNPLWDHTDSLYPIPAEERMKNPNLSQNPGY